MGLGIPSADCFCVELSESSAHQLRHENPWGNALGVFLCFFTPVANGSRFPSMELGTWLAREAETDQADGLPPTLKDPTALRLLALGLTEARRAGLVPTLPQDR